MRTRKSIVIAAILVATLVGALRLAGLSNAASQASAADDDCRLFTCIFGDVGDDD